MKKTVLITGASAGIGLETARFFHSMGWNVIATMRNPQGRKTELHSLDIDIQEIDVTDLNSIKTAVSNSIEKYGTIDVLVNNAGYFLKGPFEYCSREEILKLYTTNVFGLMDITRELIPHFRKRASGMIINVSSIGGRISSPFSEVYNSTKWAIEGFSEGLYHELKPLSIKVKLVEPGIVKSDFYTRSVSEVDISTAPEYAKLYSTYNRKMDPVIEKGSHPVVIAQLIYRAATDRRSRLRYPGAAFAGILLTLRKLLPDSIFLGFNQLK